MHVAKKRKRSRKAVKPSAAGLNGKVRSLRELKAFGMWADRADAKDAVPFTKELRTRMEQGTDAR